MRLRAERAADRVDVRRVTELAFGQPDEADLVERLHEARAALVALVAELDEPGEQERGVVGHVLFSPVSVLGRAAEQAAEVRIAGLAPLSVLPEHQSRGVGSALVRAGLARCGELELAAVVVLGHARYYPRFGFRPAHELGLSCEYDVPAGVFQALELTPGSLRGVAGVVRYHSAFTAVV
jgi:putative acetyltransferase